MVLRAIPLVFLLVGFSRPEICGFDCQGNLEDVVLTRFRSHNNRGLVGFYLYTRERQNNPEYYSLDRKDARIFSTFRGNRTTKIIVHGWRNWVPSQFSTVLKKGYLAAGDYNLVMVDWSSCGSLEEYPWARSRVQSVATQLAAFIDQLVISYNLDPRELHVIGHSLGAHVAGVAGHLITVGTIGRMTGLDPAKPMFDLSRPREMLTRSSAAFVDVVHSCGMYVGILQALGHVDFYPNGGYQFQPGCGFDIFGECSHRRSYGYFAESILNSDGFLGLRCESWSSYKRGRCETGEVVPMGEHVPREARGIYYLKTNNREPFAVDQENNRL